MLGVGFFFCFPWGEEKKRGGGRGGEVIQGMKHLSITKISRRRRLLPKRGKGRKKR